MQLKLAFVVLVHVYISLYTTLLFVCVCVRTIATAAEERKIPNDFYISYIRSRMEAYIYIEMPDNARKQAPTYTDTLAYGVYVFSRKKNVQAKMAPESSFLQPTLIELTCRQQQQQQQQKQIRQPQRLHNTICNKNGVLLTAYLFYNSNVECIRFYYASLFISVPFLFLYFFLSLFYSFTYDRSRVRVFCILSLRNESIQPRTN